MEPGKMAVSLEELQALAAEHRDLDGRFRTAKRDYVLQQVNRDRTLKSIADEIPLNLTSVYRIAAAHRGGPIREPKALPMQEHDDPPPAKVTVARVRFAEKNAR